jgi:hypothetical protein
VAEANTRNRFIATFLAIIGVSFFILFLASRALSSAEYKPVSAVLAVGTAVLLCWTFYGRAKVVGASKWLALMAFVPGLNFLVAIYLAWLDES